MNRKFTIIIAEDSIIYAEGLLSLLRLSFNKALLDIRLIKSTELMEFIMLSEAEHLDLLFWHLPSEFGINRLSTEIAILGQKMPHIKLVIYAAECELNISTLFSTFSIFKGYFYLSDSVFELQQILFAIQKEVVSLSKKDLKEVSEKDYEVEPIRLNFTDSGTHLYN